MNRFPDGIGILPQFFAATSGKVIPFAKQNVVRYFMNIKISITIVIIVIPLFSLCQLSTQAKTLLGKWKLKSEMSEDSSCMKEFGKEFQEYYNFLKDHTYIEITIRNDEKVKATYHSVGKWKILDNGKTLLLYNRRPDPPKKHVTYGDMNIDIRFLSQSALSLYGMFSVCGEEGAFGTLRFVKIK